jgi:dimethylargininase
MRSAECWRFSRAIVRKPGPNFLDGVTTSKLGPPIFPKALEQHEKYWRALEACGLKVLALEEDLSFPDSTFVEDVAIVTPHRAILCRPGAESRRGEVAAIRPTLSGIFSAVDAITSPGMVDGGDICQAGNHFFIGISRRTNEEGARQLADLLKQDGFTASFVDIRSTRGLLHLKSGLNFLGDNRLAVGETLAGRKEIEGFDVVPVDPGESYAANCVRVNDHVMIAAGYPRFEASLRSLEYDVIPLNVSEFRKMDGGLSCLSLRF